MRYHFVKDVITLNNVVLRHILTRKMVVYPFTKLVAKDALLRM